MNIFKSKTRRKVEIEILKLRLQLADARAEKAFMKYSDTTSHCEVINRCKSIERDIELYRKLLTK